MPEPFIGQEALKRTRDEGGPPRTLAAFVIEGKRTPRQGMPIKADGNEVGIITSGCTSPTLGMPIAMGFIDRALNESGTKVTIDSGRAELDAEERPNPLYKKPKERTSPSRKRGEQTAACQIPSLARGARLGNHTFADEHASPHCGKPKHKVQRDIADRDRAAAFTPERDRLEAERAVRREPAEQSNNQQQPQMAGRAVSFPRKQPGQHRPNREAPNDVHQQCGGRQRERVLSEQCVQRAARAIPK